MTTLLNRPPSQKLISEIEALCFPIHAFFLLLLDELAQDEDTVCRKFHGDWLRSRSLNVQNLVRKIDLVNKLRVLN